MNTTLVELNKVFCKVFSRKDLVISLRSDASEIDGWDSFTHIALIAEIENHFKIVFTFNEIMLFKNAGDMVISIEKHLQATA
jgi:acyl carrier protein